jgi:hypothetical protein
MTDTMAGPNHEFSRLERSGEATKGVAVVQL